MFRPLQTIRLTSIGAYFIASYVMLHWFAGDSYFCARSSPFTTCRLALACTIWDLLSCLAGVWIGQKMMNLRTAIPLSAAALSALGIASAPFWIYRGYGHFLFEGTWADVSCYFAEGFGMAFPFVVAPLLGLLTLLHVLVWMRTGKAHPAIVVG